MRTIMLLLMTMILGIEIRVLAAWYIRRLSNALTAKSMNHAPAQIGLVGQSSTNTRRSQSLLATTGWLEKKCNHSYNIYFV